MDIRLNDVLEMKKTHPCGEKRWQVLRTGMDFRLRCLGCGPGGDDAPVQGGKKHPRRVPGGETGGQAARVKSLRRDVGQPRPVRLENLGPREERGSLFTYGTGS